MVDNRNTSDYITPYRRGAQALGDHGVARKVMKHIDNGEDAQLPVLAPSSLTKMQFGKRLYAQMLRKGWHQSELARRADLARDAVSVYIRGRSFPTPKNLQKLATALGVSPDELLPNHSGDAIEADEVPSFEMKVSTSAPNTAWLRVNRLVTMSTAVKIAEILEADDVLDRKGGS